MMRNYIVIVISVLLSTFQTQAQTGYFGRKNSVELQYSAAPSLQYKYKRSDVNGFSFVDSKRRLINSSYSIKYNRILTNKSTVSIGIELAGMHGFTSAIVEPLFSGNPNAGRVTYRIVEPTIAYRGFSIGVNIFGRNGINPLGIRGGVTLEYGSMISDYSELTVFETQTSSNFGGLNGFDNTVSTEDFSRLQSSQVNVGAIRWNVGKNIILTRALLLKLDVSANLFSFFPNQPFDAETLFSSLGESLDPEFYQRYQYDLISRQLQTEEFENFRRTYHAYKRLTLRVGVSYAF